MTQNHGIEQLLPLPKSDEEVASILGITFTSQMPKEVLDLLLTRYVESQVYQGVVEKLSL